jgi:hypothetical protein
MFSYVTVGRAQAASDTLLRFNACFQGLWLDPTSIAPTFEPVKQVICSPACRGCGAEPDIYNLLALLNYLLY